jgi:hypothetical protein
MRHRHHQVQRDRLLQLVERVELQLLDAIAVLERVEQYLDFPACAVPVDEFSRLLDRIDWPVGQQSPLHGLDALRCVDFAGPHHSGPTTPSMPSGSEVHSTRNS